MNRDDYPGEFPESGAGNSLSEERFLREGYRTPKGAEAAGGGHPVARRTRGDSFRLPQARRHMAGGSCLPPLGTVKPPRLALPPYPTGFTSTVKPCSVHETHR